MKRVTGILLVILSIPVFIVGAFTLIGLIGLPIMMLAAELGKYGSKLIDE